MNHEPLDENLIGYLLEALDEDAMAQVAAQLQANQETRWRLEQLRPALEPLHADQEDPPPPHALAVRTIARVAEFCCLDLSHAPAAVSRSEPRRSWWRRADLVVAASLLLMVGGLGLPALYRLHHPQMGPTIVECQNNLRVFNNALQTYHDQHRTFPSVVSERPRDAAGMVVPILANAGVLREPASVRCPGNGPGFSCPLTLDQARALAPDEFFRQAGNLVPSYAYSLGHRDEEGNYYGPRVPEGQQASDFPLMADGPPLESGSGNSMNHGGAGQNVLFADGHVRFVTLRTVGFQNDDIYVNKANKVAAGLDPFDTVLGPSAAKP
jgi:prepilin-type processing-associated H-X9-DG protein